jgi:hypothetical protein
MMSGGKCCIRQPMRFNSVRLSSIGPILAELQGSLRPGQTALPRGKRHGDVNLCDSQAPKGHERPPIR